MVPTTAYNVRPNAPPASPDHHTWVYGNESGCDVIFLAGQDSGEIWRLPAHRAVLKEKNALFEIMFSGRFAQQSTVDVPDVEGRAFDNLLRFLYEEPVSVQSVETAVATLYAGHKYQCYGLVRICISFLVDNFKESNILLILTGIHVFNGGYYHASASAAESNTRRGSGSGLDMERSSISKKAVAVDGRPLSHLELFCYNPDVSLTGSGASSAGISACGVSHHMYTTTTCIEDECANLLHHCLTFIDKHGAAVLGSDELEDLVLPTLSMLLSRDTLNVGADEAVVFSAITKWADKECKRKQLPLTGTNKRDLLGAALYLPRYLTMSLKSFQDGPARSDLLTPQEIMLLSELIKSGNVGSPKHKANAESSTSLPVSTCSKNSTLTTAGVIKLLQHAPVSLLPHLQSISRPRCTRNEGNHFTNSSVPSSPNKKCGSSFLKLLQLKTCRIWCRLSRSRSVSKASTPCVSRSSSPVHRHNGPSPNDGYTNPGYTGQSGSVNPNPNGNDHYTPVNGPDVPPPNRSVLERIVVCLACFLD